MMTRRQQAAVTCGLAVMVSALWLDGGAGAVGAAAPSALRNRTIGYVLTTDHWAPNTKPAPGECPQGFNDGPREQNKLLFPDDGTKRTVVGTELKRESEIWFPTLDPEPFVFKEPIATISPGLNLDGKTGPHDYVSPTGESGIDNNFYHAVGCVEDYRPGGNLYVLSDNYLHQRPYMRVLIELTDVDSLVDDGDVTVTIYKGLSPLTTNAPGTAYLPYMSQKVDTRFAKKFVTSFHGTIAGGVLTTDPADIRLPYSYSYDDRGVVLIRGARLKLALTPERATGLWAGYMDVWSWYHTLNQDMGTSSIAQGKQAMGSIWRSLNKWADAYPDPQGRNTAISMAKEVVFTQTFIVHPPAEGSKGRAAPR